MANAKISLFFDDSQNGWEEVYYCNATSIATAVTAGDALARARARLIASPAFLSALRVQDAAITRVSQLLPYRLNGATNYASEADDVNVAAMIRLYGETGTRSRPLYLRGNPDDAYNLAQPNNADAQAWGAQLDALKTFLLNQGGSVSWQMKFKPQAIFTGGGRNVTDVDTFVVAPGNPSQALVTAGGPSGLDPGDFVTLYKIKGIPRASGLYRVVTTPSNTQFTIAFHIPSGFSYQGGGSMLKYQEGYENLGAVANLERWTRRITGRPFDVSRGRRRSIPR